MFGHALASFCDFSFLRIVEVSKLPMIYTPAQKQLQCRNSLFDQSRANRQLPRPQGLKGNCQMTNKTSRVASFSSFETF
jgi:hypothetical protein